MTDELIIKEYLTIKHVENGFKPLESKEEFIDEEFEEWDKITDSVGHDVED